MIIINNAGITLDKLFLKMKIDEWHKVINVNLNSVYYLLKFCLSKMYFIKWGRIINIASIVAQTGNIGQTNYSASKSGIIGLSKSLAKEVASKGITVNVLSPGYINTKMTKNLKINKLSNLIPSKKIGKTSDIIGVIKLLISNNSSYITGETINVNGGLYMK